MYVVGRLQSGDVESVRNELLESRAQYALQGEVAESVMMVNPVLQAVHGGTNASPIERYADQANVRLCASHLH